MFILLIFSFLSGLVTIAAPCIWPILPIVLSSAATGGKGRPLGITLGIVTSFSILTLSIAYVIKIIPFDPEILRYISVAVILFFGVSLLVPSFGAVIEGAVSKLGSKFKKNEDSSKSDFKVGFLTGLSLGVVWTPCAGPILGAIAALAATRNVSAEIITLTAFYMAGVAIPLFIFSFFGQKIFTKTAVFSKYTGKVQQIFGVVMMITAIMIFTGYDRKLQVKLLDLFPSYSSFVTELESNDQVRNKLSDLRGINQPNEIIPTMPFPNAQDQKLPNLGKAPDFVGISNWINSDSLTIDDLKGNVVLVDFWTYTCINCIRTLPYITSWYEKYKPVDGKPGLIVVGVHTPEFEFEKKTANVEAAVKQYKINYPVAQDNDYGTWQAYANHYWPAHYLIDANGIIRDTHFGEGKYEETELNIQKLLKEAGTELSANNLAANQIKTDESSFSAGGQTPETYLGLSRMTSFASNENPNAGIQTYSLPANLNRNEFAYVGSWSLGPEFAKVEEKGAGLLLNFYAKDVYLVITPNSEGDKIAVFLNDKVVNENTAGADVEDGYVKIDEPRLYHLIHLDEKTEGLLQLNFQTPGTQVFAFTFGG